MKRLILSSLMAGVILAAQETPAAHRMEIALERLESGQWATIEPGLVLHNGDKVRFRFRANFDGYLYVMNQGTSGAYELLFPREETGENNRIEADREYRIPATESWFRVDGPPGHDIVYWMVTPLRLGGGSAPKYVPLPPPPAQPAPPSSLRPRCDDSIFRARGVCVDSSGGPRHVQDPESLPANLAKTPHLRSRELIIMRHGGGAVVSAPSDSAGVVIYEYRLPHE